MTLVGGKPKRIFSYLPREEIWSEFSLLRRVNKIVTAILPQGDLFRCYYSSSQKQLPAQSPRVSPSWEVRRPGSTVTQSRHATKLVTDNTAFLTYTVLAEEIRESSTGN